MTHTLHLPLSGILQRLLLREQCNILIDAILACLSPLCSSYPHQEREALRLARRLEEILRLLVLTQRLLKVLRHSNGARPGVRLFPPSIRFACIELGLSRRLHPTRGYQRRDLVDIPLRPKAGFRRGVNLWRKWLLLKGFLCPSIHPKHNAVSTASSYVTEAIVLPFLLILRKTPDLSIV